VLVPAFPAGFPSFNIPPYLKVLNQLLQNGLDG
jgi:hypothetical protein